MSLKDKFEEEIDASGVSDEYRKIIEKSFKVKHMKNEDSGDNKLLY